MKSLPWLLASTVAVAGLCSAGSAAAQSDQAQIARPLDTDDLNSHLSRLAANPRDVNALIGAGEAAIALDDPHGAAGFFARADAIASGNGRIKAGLARVMLKLQNPLEAVRLFDQASRLGYPDTSILADRGLARDMTGDQAGAQRDYQAAIARTPDDTELVRRYAASLGISGQVQAADKMLEPLLYKSDRAAWRYRAFIYAMNNRQADAKKVAEQTMPAQLAAAIVPYMQKMPYLTAPQKAAAVHFGQFPAQIGTSIAAITPTPPAPGVPLATAPATVVAAAPSTPPQPARPLSRAEQRRQQREATRIARAEGVPVARAATAPQQPVTSAPRQPQLAQAVQPRTVQPTPPPPRPAESSPASPSSARPSPGPQSAAPSAAVQGPPAPGFESIDPSPTPPPSSNAGSQLNAIALAQASTPAAPPAAQMPPSQSAPASTPPVSAQPEASPPVQPITPVAPSPNPEATRTLADIIRAIDVPDAERQASVAAVDLDEVAALQAQRRAERQAAARAAADKAKKEATAKAKAEADAKAKKEAEEKKRLAANPSRNWLQVGVGQNKGALGFTMKGLRKKYAILSRQDGWSASWGRTNRLLVGPFASFTRVKELETELKKDGADVFAWKSDAGEVVEKLAGE